MRNDSKTFKVRVCVCWLKPQESIRLCLYDPAECPSYMLAAIKLYKYNHELKETMAFCSRDSKECMVDRSHRFPGTTALERYLLDHQSEYEAG